MQALQAALPGATCLAGTLGVALVEAGEVDRIVRSPGLRPADWAALNVAAQARGIAVEGELSLFVQALTLLRGERGYAPIVLGVTGTNGKTTTTMLTGALIAGAGRTVAVAGNVGFPMLDTLARHLDANTLPEVWVLELSSFQLDGMQGFAPKAAVVLNLTQDHLDWHGSMEDYARAKACIFGARTLRVLYRHDPLVMAMQPDDLALAQTVGVDVPRQVGDYGIERVAGVDHLVRAVQGSAGVEHALLLPCSALRIHGLHNATNALAALALAEAAGCPIGAVRDALCAYRGEPHRVEAVGQIADVAFFDDSKGTNVGATVAALEGLGPQRRLIVLLGGDGKGQDFAPLAEPVARYARAAIVYGRDGAWIHSALGDSAPVYEATSLQQAVDIAGGVAQAGDAVLLSPACASFDMFDDYEHRARVFRDAVREWADKTGHPLQELQP
ncbi:UDP-N-acetylmuramoylalanine--D-glutamate ligase [Candidatus Symbiobacter mobilis CR]|uniref:UDP-N-acetylmuramoylalanine--D-glutamate ligase n=2 Tax=Candidatus Symbiobacter TaxID=1436289 RepID=U5N6J1_9BURK|nr:UDP-N-acetylmuramoylalanine--D-glutamate ligase [Candidatus Symbiobacter mobilis CR]